MGFAADGTLKLFDFGLVTCVKTRENPSDSYTMTGASLVCVRYYILCQAKGLAYLNIC